MKILRAALYCSMITVMTTSCALYADEESEFAIKSIEEFDREVKGASKPLVAEFHSGCPVCLVTGAMVRNVVTSFGDQIKFIEIDINKIPELSDRYKITALPTVLVFVPGKTELEAKIPDPKKETLEDAINKALSLDSHERKFTLMGYGQLILLTALIILGLMFAVLVRRRKK